MPDDQTLAMILAICDLMRQNGSGAETAIAAYERAMKKVLAALQRINRSWAGYRPEAPKVRRQLLSLMNIAPDSLRKSYS